MAEKTSAEVIIGGKVYTLSGYEGEEYLQKVATYINNKLGEFQGMEELRHLSGDMKATLLQLNIADDYFKAKTQVEKLEREIEQKEKEIRRAVESTIGIAAKITLVSPNTIERSEWKSKRVDDRRKLV